ncbi:MAG: exo-alpha-sialidase [Leptospiraceae bacterium]|nr:exo-alpha-sialidase [Leptospiraceae bacterium]
MLPLVIQKSGLVPRKNALMGLFMLQKNTLYIENRKINKFSITYARNKSSIRRIFTLVFIILILFGCTKTKSMSDGLMQALASLSIVSPASYEQPKLHSTDAMAEISGQLIDETGKTIINQLVLFKRSSAKKTPAVKAVNSSVPSWAGSNSVNDASANNGADIYSAVTNNNGWFSLSLPFDSFRGTLVYAGRTLHFELRISPEGATGNAFKIYSDSNDSPIVAMIIYYVPHITNVYGGVQNSLIIHNGTGTSVINGGWNSYMEQGLDGRFLMVLAISSWQIPENSIQSEGALEIALLQSVDPDNIAEWNYIMAIDHVSSADVPTRLDNAKIKLINGIFYVVWNKHINIGNGMISDVNLIVQSNSGVSGFTDLDGNPGAHSTIISVSRPADGANNVNSLWEPFPFAAADGTLQVVWADDRPDENNHGCGQYISQSEYNGVNWSERVNVSNCNWNGYRDGMPVVVKDENYYYMIFESIYGGQNRIDLMRSVDGKIWSSRRNLARGHVGTPGLAYDPAHKKLIGTYAEVENTYSSFIAKAIEPSSFYSADMNTDISPTHEWSGYIQYTGKRPFTAWKQGVNCPGADISGADGLPGLEQDECLYFCEFQYKAAICTWRTDNRCWPKSSCDIETHESEGIYTAVRLQETDALSDEKYLYWHGSGVFDLSAPNNDTYFFITSTTPYNYINRGYSTKDLFQNSGAPAWHGSLNCVGHDLLSATFPNHEECVHYCKTLGAQVCTYRQLDGNCFAKSGCSEKQWEPTGIVYTLARNVSLALGRNTNAWQHTLNCPGNDWAQKVGTNQSQCSSFCEGKNAPYCTWREDGHCWAKGGCNQTIETDGLFSSYAIYSRSLWVQGWNCPGADIGIWSNQTRDACLLSCKSIDANHCTWRSSDNTCWAKSGCPVPVTEGPEISTITLLKAVPNQGLPYAWQHMLNCPGNDITPGQWGVNQSACLDLCVGLNAGYCTWREDGVCWPKSRCVPVQEQGEQWPAIYTKPLWQKYINCPGEDLPGGVQNSTDLGNCQKFCAAKNAAYCTWREEDGMCWAKSGCANRRMEGTGISSTSLWKMGVNCKGYDLSAPANNKTMDECRSYCEEKKANWCTWRRDGYCWAKSSCTGAVHEGYEIFSLEMIP